MRGFDGNKQLVGGVKRHIILVATEGVLLAVVVHAGCISDRKGGQRVLEAAGDAYPRLQHSWADHGYAGARVRGCAGARGAAQDQGWKVPVVYPHFRQLTRYAPELLAALGAR